MSRITDFMTRIFPARSRVLLGNWYTSVFNAWDITSRTYASLIWYNLCDLLTDIVEDVQINIEAQTEDARYFGAAFRAFVYSWGRVVLQQLFDQGYCVIGYSNERTAFWIMNANEYSCNNETVDKDKPELVDVTAIRPYNPSVQVYVMRSATHLIHQRSDRAICKPWLDFLDDVCNGSATISKRLGAVVVASPKNLTNAPTQTVLNKEQKEALEREMREEYGSLSSQSNIMLLPREMSWQVINLAGLDLKTLDKAKMCILAIADRIKVPANQSAIIDANSMKTLANGSELREGDKAKYKSFRRLFERTFAQMAIDLGIKMTYTITGEPVDEPVAAAANV